MSHFDRIDPITQKPKGAFDQVLTSWFLDAHSKAILSKHFLLDSSWAIPQAKIQAGFFEHEDDIYLPVFYQGRIPSHPDQKSFSPSERSRTRSGDMAMSLSKQRKQRRPHNEHLCPLPNRLPVFIVTNICTR